MKKARMSQVQKEVLRCLAKAFIISQGLCNQHKRGLVVIMR